MDGADEYDGWMLLSCRKLSAKKCKSGRRRDGRRKTSDRGRKAGRVGPGCTNIIWVCYILSRLSFLADPSLIITHI
jgi:hypothetical protein